MEKLREIRNSRQNSPSPSPVNQLVPPPSSVKIKLSPPPPSTNDSSSVVVPILPNRGSKQSNPPEVVVPTQEVKQNFNFDSQSGQKPQKEVKQENSEETTQTDDN